MTTSIEKAVSALNEGGVILYPTDTIWGLGCDATNEDAVQRVYRIKDRTDAKSMLVLVDRFALISQYVEAIPEMAQEIIEITDQPLTIIYPQARNLASNLIAEDGSIGIRICQAPICQKLIRQFGRPIVSTSANKSGHPPPVRFSDIESLIIKEVDCIIEGKGWQSRFNKPSPIIKLGMDNQIQIIRQ
jgi:L-threonylcarbamoyladenylate synthase